jgi:hypothetical protein
MPRLPVVLWLLVRLLLTLPGPVLLGLLVRDGRLGPLLLLLILRPPGN